MTKRYAFENFEPELIAQPIETAEDVRLNKLLNFYNTVETKNRADLSREWVIEYMTRVQYLDSSVDVLLKVEPWRITNSVVTISRLWLLGAQLGTEIIERHHERIANIIHDYRKKNPADEPVVIVEEKAYDPVKVAEGILIEIEKNLDNYASNEYVGRFPSTYDLLYMRKATKPVATFVREKMRPLADEISLLAKGNCPKDLKEAYSRYSPEALSSLVKAVRSIVDEADRYVAGRSVTRKPRKKKVKSPEELVSGMTYCSTFKDLSLSSIDPKHIISSHFVFLYNTKYKKITRLAVNGAKGLTVRGTTIEGFDPSMSCTKIIPNPTKFFDNFNATGNPAMHRKMFEGIETKCNPANGRVGKDTVILGASK